MRENCEWWAAWEKIVNKQKLAVILDFNRHCVLMDLVDGYTLQNINQVEDPADLYDKLMNLLLKFANHGVIHGDFNEFNIMIDDDANPIIIDFPQGRKPWKNLYTFFSNCRQFFLHT